MGRKVGAALIPIFREVMPTLMGHISACAGNQETAMLGSEGTVVIIPSVHHLLPEMALNLPITPIFRILPSSPPSLTKAKEGKIFKSFLTNSGCDKNWQSIWCKFLHTTDKKRVGHTDFWKRNIHLSYEDVSNCNMLVSYGYVTHYSKA